MVVLRIANCSGFYGDRLSAAREMVEGGPIDFLTGDWLAELTMGLLIGKQERGGRGSYARTFVKQMEEVLASCLDRGIRIVANAGGLDPNGCAAAVDAIASRVGLHARVAVVHGDDVTDEFAARRRTGWTAPHLVTGEPLPESDGEPLIANAYLGAWGIASALDRGADIVITGRVSDASLVVGPAASHFGWRRDDWDALAGAVAAGHVIECGPQVTGGNYSFPEEVASFTRLGFPIAEVREDGSAVITKHPGSGGMVTAETVIAQLLYEIDGLRYPNPDVVARFDTVTVRQLDTDRVEVSGTRGEPAPSSAKVGVIFPAGWSSEMTFLLTGLDVDLKVRIAQDAVWGTIPGGRAAFDEVDVSLIGGAEPDPRSLEKSYSLLRVAVADQDRDLVERFSRGVVETMLAGYPGQALTSPPTRAASRRRFWPTSLPVDGIAHSVTMEGETWSVEAAPWDDRAGTTAGSTPPPISRAREDVDPGAADAESEEAATVVATFGDVVGARSGDKGGNATVGIWARTDEGHRWLANWWGDPTVRGLLPEEHRQHELRLWYLPNIRAVGVTIVGYLGEGVGSNLTLDGQAKGLGEYLRARLVEIPVSLVTSHETEAPSTVAGGTH